MGGFSKIFKGIKKGFKKIGKGVKSAFQKFGKFMGKIGILGQIAMMFILPGIGNALLNSFSGLLQGAWTSSLKGLAALGKGAGLGAKVAKAASWTMGKAQQFAQFGQAGFKTVTEGVTKFFEHTGKYVGSKLGITQGPNIGIGEAWQNYQGDMVKSWDKFAGKGADLLSPGIESVLPKEAIVSEAAGKAAARAAGEKPITYDFEKPTADLTAVGESGYYQDSAGNLYGSPSEQGWHVRADATAAIGGRAYPEIPRTPIESGDVYGTPVDYQMDLPPDLASRTHMPSLPTRIKYKVTDYIKDIPGKMIKGVEQTVSDLPETAVRMAGSMKLSSLMAGDGDYQRGGVYQPFQATDYTGAWEKGMASRQPDQIDPYLKGIPQTGFGDPDGFWGPPVYSTYMKRFAS